MQHRTLGHWLARRTSCAHTAAVCSPGLDCTEQPGPQRVISERASLSAFSPLRLSSASAAPCADATDFALSEARAPIQSCGATCRSGARAPAGDLALHGPEAPRALLHARLVRLRVDDHVVVPLLGLLRNRRLFQGLHIDSRRRKPGRPSPLRCTAALPQLQRGVRRLAAAPARWRRPRQRRPRRAGQQRVHCQGHGALQTPLTWCQAGQPAVAPCHLESQSPPRPCCCLFTVCSGSRDALNSWGRSILLRCTVAL